MGIKYDWAKIQRATQGDLKHSTGFAHVSESDKLRAFTELEARIEGYLEKVEDAEAFLDRNQSDLNQWSDEAYDLYVSILRLGLLPDICNSIYLNNYFKSLRFIKQGIFEIDLTM